MSKLYKGSMEQKNNIWMYTNTYKLFVLTNYKRYKQTREARAFLRREADRLGISHHTMYKHLADWRKEYRCMVSN